MEESLKYSTFSSLLLWRGEQGWQNSTGGKKQGRDGTEQGNSGQGWHRAGKSKENTEHPKPGGSCTFPALSLLID